MDERQLARQAVAEYVPGPSTVYEVNGLTLVTSSPIKMHTAIIRRSAAMDYVVRMISVAFDPIVGRYGTFEAARQGAGRAVTQKTVADWKLIFSGVQRIAMGQQQCPYRHRNRLCLAPASGRSVWCEGHPKGRSVDVSG